MRAPRVGMLVAATYAVLVAPAGADQPPAGPAPAEPAAAPADQVEGLTVLDIRIEGRQQLSEAYIRSQIRTAVGEPYADAVVREDIRRLLRTGKFADVYATTRVEEGGVTVIFHVQERPTLVDVRFEGNREVGTDRLRDESGIAPGDPLSLFAVRQAARRLLEYYHSLGYNEAQVTFDEDQVRSERIVVYRIVEGPRVRVSAVRFEGNNSYRDLELLWQIQTRPYFPLLQPGLFDVDQIARDEEALRRFYRDRGYLDVRVSHRVEFDEAREKATVTFLIDEGVRYTVRQVSLEGNEQFPEERLRALLSTAPGAFFVRTRLEQDTRRLLDFYGQRGYLEAVVQPAWVFTDEPGTVDVTFHITEGPSYRVGEVVIRGNRTTKDKVVRREVRLLPGGVFDLVRARESERRLRESPIFKSARITPVGQDPVYRDALVEVEEAERTGQILFGFGVTSNSGLIGNIVIENNNFDIADWPRSLEELFRGQAFRGAGQSLRLQLEPGTEFNRFRIDFTEPYLLDQPISLGTSLYLFERGRDEYDERRLGIHVRFGRRFESGLLENWSAELALRLEWVKIDSIGLFAARDIRDAEGQNFITSATLSLAYDTTDSRLVPTRGYRFATAYEQAGALGGDFTFGKLSASYTWYRTLRIDEFDRKHVLALRARTGFIFGDAPVFERFYAGGIGSMRGFEFRGISPRAGIREDRVGGDFLLLTGAEYSFPLVGDTLRGVVFLDMGTVESSVKIDNWRVALGAGLRLTLDFFGPIPLEFDFAVPLVKDDDDDTQVFSFFLGTTF